MTLSMLVLSLALAFPAAAEADKHAGPCKADAEKFCKDVEPGGGRIKKCLKEHEADLSPECKAKGSEMKKKVDAMKAEFAEACKEDKDKFCKDVEEGKGGLKKCIKEHEAELSDKCKGFVAGKKQAAKERKAALEEACGKDKEQFCKDVPAGEGRILKCMREHKDELSDGCKDFVKSKREGKDEKPAAKDEKPAEKKPEGETKEKTETMEKKPK
jgi:hypothetical protein